MENNNYLSLSGLFHFFAKIKSLFATKDEINDLRVSKVEGIKGDAETIYRTGKVNLTPTNIGAVAKSGDTMNGLLQLQRGCMCYTFNPGDITNSAYYCFGIISITSAYVSHPTITEISMRGHDHTSIITFAPIDSSSFNTGVRIFSYEGDDIDVYTWRVTGNGAIYFPLYLKVKAYQTVHVLRLNGFIPGYEFSKADDLVTTLPDYAIKAVPLK